MSHSTLQATAARLIIKHGRAMKLRSQVTSGTAWDPTIVPNDQDVTGVVLEYDETERGPLIQANDKKVLLSSAVSPDTSMKLVDGSDIYEIVRVTPIQPGTVLILNELQVRK